MAGMLPGVEAARRRRFHNSYNGSAEISPNSTSRRSSFCLYASSHDFLPTSSSMRNPVRQKGMCDESMLGAAAREAKKRLDQRLQPLWKSETKRKSNCEHISKSMDNMPPMVQLNSTQLPKLRQKKSKGLNWLKISWKLWEQKECVVCLEQLKSERGKTLMQLSCGHRFHTKCLMPWLEGNAHCPCCRMTLTY